MTRSFTGRVSSEAEGEGLGQGQGNGKGEKLRGVWLKADCVWCFTGDVSHVRFSSSRAAPSNSQNPPNGKNTGRSFFLYLTSKPLAEKQTHLPARLLGHRGPIHVHGTSQRHTSLEEPSPTSSFPGAAIGIIVWLVCAPAVPGRHW